MANSDAAVGPARYPAHWEADVILRDGGAAHVRPIRPTDADAVQAMHLKQSEQSIYLRFFAPMPRLSDKDLRRFTNVDHKDRVAFVVLVADEIIGIGRYDRVNTTDAEVAFNISDHHQGRGLGSVLLEHLAAAARERGIRRFVAEVLPQNRKMVGVFRDAGYEVAHHFEDGVIEMEFPIDATARSVAVMQAREHRAEANSLAGLLRAESVAIVGAGHDDPSFGSILLRNILAAGYTGAVHVVHPELEQVQGISAVRRLGDIEGGVHLALMAIPAQKVMDSLLDCAAAKVRGIVVYTNGFAETGEAGQEMQKALVRRARGLGMRVLGPSTLGLINNSPDFRLNATPVEAPPERGRLGLYSQSAALGVALLAAADRRGLAISSFVNSGNRADVSGNDLMQFWEEDDDTAVVGLYLEGTGNPRKFSRIARALAKSKPTIVVKSGKGRVPGQIARQARVPAEVWNSMLLQAGVIQVSNIHQMLDLAQLLTTMPVPQGNRVGIVANSEALAAIALESAQGWGLEMGMTPVSVEPDAPIEDFEAALTRVMTSQDVDIVVVSLVPQVGSDGSELVAAVNRVAGDSPRTIAACFIGMPASRSDSDQVVPVFPTPEDAVRTVAVASQYGQRQREDTGELVNPDGIDPVRARAIVTESLAAMGDPRPGTEPQRLAVDGMQDLLACYGIEILASRRVHTPDEAVAAADELGWPVTVKYASRRVRERLHDASHRLGVEDEAELRHSMSQLTGAVPPEDVEAGFLVQSMAPPGAPVSIVSTEDPLYGPVLSFGIHGDPVELLGDVAHRVAPVTTGDVTRMVTQVRASARLFGHKGSPRLAVESLEDLIARVSRLADDLPEVVRMELRPVMVTEGGVVPLACRLWIAPPQGRTDDGTRRISLS